MNRCKFCRTLYIALVELMVVEGGEPSSAKQRAAWEKANEVIQQYKEKLEKSKVIMGSPKHGMSYNAVKSMLEAK